MLRLEDALSSGSFACQMKTVSVCSPWREEEDTSSLCLRFASFNLASLSLTLCRTT